MIKEKLKGSGGKVEQRQLPKQKKTGGSISLPQQEPQSRLTPRNTGSNELSAVNIRQIFEDSRGRRYAVSGGSVDIYTDEGTWMHLDAGEELPGGPEQVMEDEQNRIWIATTGGLVQFDMDLNVVETITTANSNLKMNSVNTMASSNDGSLWLGHNVVNYSSNPDTVTYAGGISVYDPSQGEVVAVRDTGLVNGPVSDIHVRNNGDVWVSVSPGDVHVDEGVYVYRPSADSAWTYRENNSGLPQNQVSSLAEDSEGTMWLGLSTEDQRAFYTTSDDTLTGVASFDGASWTDFSDDNTGLDDDCQALAIDNQGTIYYGSYDTTMVYDGSSWSAYAGGNSRFPLDGMQSMMINSNGNKVFATGAGNDLTGGGIHMDGSDGWEFISTQNDNGLFSNTIFGLTVDAQGRIWASGFNGVAYRENGEWTYFNTHDGMASTYVWKILAASDGTIWMGNSENGVTRYTNGSLEVYDEYGSFVETILEDSDGHVWMGSFNGKQPGVLQHDGNQFTYHDTLQGTLGQRVTSIEEGPDGNIYASNEFGTAKYDGQEWSQWLPEGLMFSSEMETGANGNLWVATPDSLVEWDGSNLTSHGPSDGIVGYASHVEAAPGGSIWINTYSYRNRTEDGTPLRRTLIYDNGSWSLITTTSIPYITAHDSSGSTWIGTNGKGLYKFNRSDAVAIEEGQTRPDQYSLSDNYPNPFNPATRISYNLPRQEHVRLTVYDMLGREVTTLVDGTRNAGSHQVNFDASNLASGVYMYRLEAGSFTQTKKMILLQ